VWLTQCRCLTLLSVEVHVATRSDLRPDPEFDEIRALFYSLHVDRPAATVGADGVAKSRDIDSDGVIVVSHDSQRLLKMTGVGGSLTVTYVDTEIDLLSTVVSLVTQYVRLLYTYCLSYCEYTLWVIKMDHHGHRKTQKHRKTFAV